MLSIGNLRVGIGDKEILHGISLDVKPGEIHAVMGPNGSGKSTLAATLMGNPAYRVINSSNSDSADREEARSPSTSSGLDWELGARGKTSKVSMEGEDILNMSPDERAMRGLFLAFQYPVEVMGVQVAKFLRLAYEARFGDQPEKRFNSVVDYRRYLEKLADELDVNKELLTRGLNEGFSGGEKKRLEILQMAVLEPKYAILDETDSGLDIDAIQAVAAGVNKIVEKFNTGVIVITHYQRILKFLRPNRVHVVVKGEVVESGDGELVNQLEKDGYKSYLEV